MRRIERLFVVIGTAGVFLAHAGETVTATGSAETPRTVYFSAADSTGAAITDLTAADLVVKENGKERAIASVQAATAPMHIALLVDDGGSGAFQAGVAKFLEAMYGKAQFAISMLNPQPLTLTDYTDNKDALNNALGRLGQRGRIEVDGEQIIEAVSRTAAELKKRGAARPVIVVLTVNGETELSERAQGSLDSLKNSGASLNLFYLNGLNLGRVLGDGPKQSGGVIASANAGTLLGNVLTKVADNLQHQYVLTYTLPDGVKPNERFQLSTSRKGVTLVAPQRIADK